MSAPTIETARADVARAEHDCATSYSAARLALVEEARARLRWAEEQAAIAAEKAAAEERAAKTERLAELQRTHASAGMAARIRPAAERIAEHVVAAMQLVDDEVLARVNAQQAACREADRLARDLGVADDSGSGPLGFLHVENARGEVQRAIARAMQRSGRAGVQPALWLAADLAFAEVAPRAYDVPADE